MRNVIFVAVAMAGMSSAALAETIHIGVNGLVCAFCVKGIEQQFNKNDAVESVSVDLDTKQVAVITKGAQTLDDAVIKTLITDAGYTLTTIHRQP